MAKNILGVDVGHDRLKLALVSENQVKKTVSVAMPHNMLKEGHVTSTEAMGQLIRTTMKENKIKCKKAALVLSDESVFVRNVTMPEMNAEQLVYNLPYEFRDYITDELKNYVFDYAMISTPEEMDAQNIQEDEENGERTAPGRTMDLLAVAAPVSLIDELKDMMRKAGLKLIKAAPTVCSYAALIRKMQEKISTFSGEYGILDLGYETICMYIFRGDCHMATRVLEIGLSSIDEAISDAYNVDIHLAHTYLLTNHDDCQNKDVCLRSFEHISVELMRALNFYSFNNMDSRIDDIWICGGGAAIPSLKAAIESRLDKNIHRADELIPGNEIPEECYSFVQAIGITQD